MKKHKWIIAVIILAFLAVIPIPTGVYKDGGSREYTALTYKIVDWHCLYGNGNIYDEVKVYPFPLNFFSMDSLLAREEQHFENPDIYFTTPEPTAYYPDTYGINSQYIRIGNRDEVYPKTLIIRSRQELDAYFTESVERNEYNDWGQEFLDICKRYDDAYFEQRILVLVLLSEGSGSIRHKVTNVYMDNEGYLNIRINVVIPQIGTSDMAYWHIFVEPDKDVDITNQEQIRLILENVCAHNDHEPIQSPQVVDDPFIGYCGNTQTTVYFEGRDGFSFTGSQSVTLTQILNDLAYSWDMWCCCDEEYTVDTEFGTGYEISLTKAFVRCDQGQAALTREQIEQIESILSWAQEQEDSV